MATDAPLAPAASRLDVRALLQAQAASSTRPSVVVDKEDDLQYDLGHLCAFDPSPVDAEALREDREGHLLRTARDNMQLLANQLYGLLAGAQEKSVIRLPPPVTQLPREKPLPEARQLTRWEKFAKEKGIVKHKRSKMVWDEEKQVWAPRYGFGRANNPKDKMQDWVIEAKPGDDPNVDPFEAREAPRKMKLTKQKTQQERNRREASHAAGASSKGAGAGIDRNALKDKDDMKKYLGEAMSAAQVSTASVGRFDKMLRGEVSRDKGKRKQYETATQQGASSKDTARSQQVFKRMFPDNKVGTAIDTSQAVKQANISTEADNRKKKVAKVAANATKGKAAKSAPRKSGTGKTGGAVKAKSKPTGKPKKK